MQDFSMMIKNEALPVFGRYEGLPDADFDFNMLSEYLLDDDGAQHEETYSTGGDGRTSSRQEDDDSDDDSCSVEDGGGKGGKDGDRSRAQVDRRRERNRVLARKTRLRKKFFFESLQKQVAQLAMENEMLKGVVREKMNTDLRNRILSECTAEVPAEIMPVPPAGQAPSVLGKTDFSLMEAIRSAQRSFVITDPSLPDNPIIFASKGFLDLTLYPLDQVLGRNCRFLQGPKTDQRQVVLLREGVMAGLDTSICLLNYKADGTEFFNQIFVAALRDADNAIINYVGVQVEITQDKMKQANEAALAAREMKEKLASMSAGKLKLSSTEDTERAIEAAMMTGVGAKIPKMPPAPSAPVLAGKGFVGTAAAPMNKMSGATATARGLQSSASASTTPGTSMLSKKEVAAKSKAVAKKSAGGPPLSGSSGYAGSAADVSSRNAGSFIAPVPGLAAGGSTKKQVPNKRAKIERSSDRIGADCERGSISSGCNSSQSSGVGAASRSGGPRPQVQLHTHNMQAMASIGMSMHTGGPVDEGGSVSNFSSHQLHQQQLLRQQHQQQQQQQHMQFIQQMNAMQHHQQQEQQNHQLLGPSMPNSTYSPSFNLPAVSHPHQRPEQYLGDQGTDHQQSNRGPSPSSYGFAPTMPPPRFR